MKKLISLVLIMSLLFSQPAQATFFTDLFGGLFTIVSYPIQLILGSTKSPFFASQNPFVEKEWHKEERLAVGRKPQELPSSTSIPQQPDTKASEGNPADTVSPAPTPERTPTPTPSPSPTPTFSPKPRPSPTTEKVGEEAYPYELMKVVCGISLLGLVLLGWLIYPRGAD